MTPDELLNSHLHLATIRAKTFHKGMPPSISYDELYSAALVGLWEATKKWEPGKSPFPAYATMCIKRNMIDWVRKMRRKKGSVQVPVNMGALAVWDGIHKKYDSLESVVVDHRSDRYEEVDNEDVIEHELAKYPRHMQRMLKNHFMCGYSLPELAWKHGTTTSRVFYQLQPYRARAGVSYTNARVKKIYNVARVG